MAFSTTIASPRRRYNISSRRTVFNRRTRGMREEAKCCMKRLGQETERRMERRGRDEERQEEREESVGAQEGADGAE